MNRDELLAKLHQQNVGDAQERKNWEETLKRVDVLLAQTRRVVNFREYYCWWLKNTREGQQIRVKLLEIQSGKCFWCKGELLIPDMNGVPIDHSEIHHLAPLTLLQRYAEAKPQIAWTNLSVFAISAEYLRLVHPRCNKQIGEQVGDLSELQFLKEFLSENK